MYNNTKANYSTNFRSLGGMLEDIFQGTLGKNIYDDFPARSVPVNIRETDASYELHMIVPGLNKEDFKLNLDRDILTISYDKAEESNEQTDKWIRKEYKMRSFKRSFTMTDKINTDGISARYNDGILIVDLPKKADAEPASKEIKVG